MHALKLNTPLGYDAVINAANQFNDFNFKMEEVLESIETRQTHRIIIEDLFMISVNEISNCFYYMNYSNLDEQRRYFHPGNQTRYQAKDQEEIIFSQIYKYLEEAEYLVPPFGVPEKIQYAILNDHMLKISSVTTYIAKEIFALICRAFYQSDVGRWYHHDNNASLIKCLTMTGYRNVLDVSVRIGF